MRLKFPLVLVILFSLTSCKTYFNESIRKAVQQTDLKKIEQVQFYTDRKIKLEYRTTNANEAIEGGKVKIESGYYLYTITIPKHTKSKAQHLDKNRLKVFFEEGQDSYLIFKRDDKNMKYVLDRKPKAGSFYIDYENKEFRVTSGNLTQLMIKKDNSQNIKTKNKKVKGIKVN